MNAAKWILLGLVLGNVMALAGATAAPEGTAGPLVGHVTANEAVLWMYVPEGSETTVTFGREDSGEAGKKATFAVIPDLAVTKEVKEPEEEAADGAKIEGKPDVDLDEEQAFGVPMRVTLDGLQADARYEFQVAVGGKKDPAWAGSFRTATVDGTPGKFRVALTSCMKIGQPLASWYLLLAQQPDLHLTVGDTHYADTTDPKVQWEHHVRYRRLPEMATVLRNMPTYSIWDDHDYGPNNSDGTAKGKEGSLKGWTQFWGNPGAGTPETPGAFYKFRRGEVEFFMVDGRYHRSPDKDADDENKRMLGDAQFTWLLEGLKTSTAKFKIIASGSTLFQSHGDGWRIYTFSRHRLMDSIKEHDISGVMYCSGDVHASMIMEHPESERVGYPFVEVISSGVANSKTLSFATLDFDTAAEDPTVRVRIVWGDGTVRDDRTWTLSELGGK